ncbi:MAG: indolepyruvate ferredoxin oxidoreductase family protein [Paracoccus sp. (in: a-proteobacteria)]
MLDIPASPLNEWLVKTEGRVLLTGTQALARLPMLQAERDRAAGLNTAGYVSGYRGSPLGGVDSMMTRSRAALDEYGITFQPGLNEELAATALWGTQQIEALGDATVDGVFGYWYGKGPGVERAADALRHGNFAGSHKNGGVLVVYGDDHPGKSSTTAHQSEQTLAALMIPSLYPADVQDFLRFGLLGWALARYSGSWVGFKCVNETVEQTLTIDLDFNDLDIKLPALEDGDLPSGGLHIRPRAYNPQEVETVVSRQRLPLIRRFVRANRIDRAAFGAARPKLGIVTAGKAYHDVIQALSLLGLSENRARELGVGVYKVGCIWPLEPEGLHEFSAQADTLFFVEEKRAFLEAQAREIFYNDTQRPTIIGKTTTDNEIILPEDVQLLPSEVARATLIAMQTAGIDTAPLQGNNAKLPHLPGKPKTLPPRNMMRIPYFCSGCPHGRSTQVPEGSVGFGGIGCHAMALFRNDQGTLPPTQMGGEGANWIGMSRYSGTSHVFQNLGDGTFLHSGILSVRAAVASGVNITFKILYNDAVAMTGGQPHDGPLTAEGIAARVVAEDVIRCVIISEEPTRFRGLRVPEGVDILPRTELLAVQEEFRAISGTTVIIYDQTCAAEKRRRRKKGKYPNPAKRVFIFDEVCEGCGDCSTVSTCVSIEPKDTPLGTKRRINQSTCNKDFSCNEGFCPSFVTVLNAEPVAAELPDLGDLGSSLPHPERKAGTLNTMITGIGGTGVITVSAILARAAHTDGLAASCYDMTGLAQKNGAVFSHLKIGADKNELGTQRIGLGEADLIMAFDLLAAIQPEAVTTIRNAHTRIVGNTDVAVTALFQMDRTDAARPIKGAAASKLEQAAGKENGHFVNATKVAEQLCGDAVGVNLMLVGYALQLGLLPVSLAAIENAIELNGVAIALNKRAFLLGRVLAHSPEKLMPLLRREDQLPPQTLDELLKDRMQRLESWQNKKWAKRYLGFIGQVCARAGDGDFAMAVATSLARLMTYKDEYEVARLYSSAAFKEKLATEFGDAKDIRFNLAPPLFAKRDRRTGHLQKREFRAGTLKMFGLLSWMRRLRGTPFDLFGYTAERKMERQLIAEYMQEIEVALDHVDGPRSEIALQIAALPSLIKGFGYVKEKNVTRYHSELARLKEELAAPVHLEAAE